jgi:hypothetical protein
MLALHDIFRLRGGRGARETDAAACADVNAKAWRTVDEAIPAFQITARQNRDIIAPGASDTLMARQAQLAGSLSDREEAVGCRRWRALESKYLENI